MVVAAACGDTSSDRDGAGGTGGTGGAAGADVVARTCKSGDPCPDGAECSYSGLEAGIDCKCDPSGHFLCDPWGGGGSPPWPPCTDESAATQDYDGACAEPATTCTETNGWCTRTCTCGSTCEIACDGEGEVESSPGVLCDASYCDDGTYGSCEFISSDCNYKVTCNEDVTITGSCP
jgi:hypothetical protein